MIRQRLFQVPSQTSPNCLLLLIIITGMVFQFATYANHDTIVIIFSIEKWIQGGHYGSDFFNTLTPMSLILFYPPVKLAMLLSLSPTILTTVYVTFFILFSLWLTSSALRRYYPQHVITTWSMTYAFLFFFYVQNDFLQRDVLCIILVLPYIVSLVTDEQNARSPAYDVVSAVLAGFGFAIKPHFLLAWFCLTLYNAISQRSISTLFKWQNLLIASIVSAYALSIYFFFDDYLNHILPYIFNGFYKTYYYHQPSAMNNASFLTYCAGLLYFFIYRQYQAINKLVSILLIASLGFMFDYLLQGKSWFYHAFPMMVCFFLALSLSVNDFIAHRDKYPIASTYHTLILSLATLIFYLIMIVTIYLCFNGIRITYLTTYGKNNPYGEMTHYLRKHSHTRYVGLITADVRQGNLVIYYSGHRPATRFDHLWLLSSLVLEAPTYEALIDPTRQKTRQFIIDALINDIKRYSPDILLVDISVPKQYLYDIDFDYIDYLSHDSRFKRHLSQYRYLENKANFAIYQRIQTAQKATSA